MKVVYVFIRVINSQEIDRELINGNDVKALAEKISKLNADEYDVVEAELNEYEDLYACADATYTLADEWNNCDDDSTITERRWVISEFKKYLNEIGVKKNYFKYISEHWCVPFIVSIEQFKREVESFKK